MAEKSKTKILEPLVSELLTMLGIDAKVVIKTEKGDSGEIHKVGYRKEQEQRLQAIAQKVAERVRFEKREVEMRPMPAFERRVVHMAIAKVDDVESGSVGEGRDRRIVVKPSAASS
jgi:predicted RNA-binding protein Jag